MVFVTIKKTNKKYFSGAHNISTHALDEPGKMTVKVSKALRHPDKPGDPEDRAIALLRLETSVPLPPEEPYRWMICLPTPNPSPPNSTTAATPLLNNNESPKPLGDKTSTTIYGWGQRVPVSYDMSDVPFRTELEKIDCPPRFAGQMCVNGKTKNFCKVSKMFLVIEKKCFVFKLDDK